MPIKKIASKMETNEKKRKSELIKNSLWLKFHRKLSNKKRKEKKEINKTFRHHRKKKRCVVESINKIDSSDRMSNVEQIFFVVLDCH